MWMAVINSEKGFSTNIDVELENPADMFWRKVEPLWEGIKGLNLSDQRRVPGRPVLDVSTLMSGSSKWDDAGCEDTTSTFDGCHHCRG